MTTRKHAFTLIELLVVIGIIAVLGAMFTIGAKSLSRRASDDQTRVLLKTYSSMLAELRTVAGPNRPLPFPQTWQTPTGGNITAGGDRDFWNIYNGSRTAGNILAYEPPKELVLNAEKLFSLPPVRNTHLAVQRLAACPNNRTAFSKIPSDRLVSLRELARANAGPVNDFGLTDLPILLDAWGNPIIFVPAAGLGPVMLSLNASDRWVIRSGGLLTEAQARSTPLRPTDRPFFASAGPDGTFGHTSEYKLGTADDNLYSFQD